MRHLLTNAHILTMDRAFTEYGRGWLLTDGGRIAALGGGEPPEAPGARRIDCGGGILLPGMVNLHCHAAMVPFRTMGDDCADRLRRFLFPLENEALTPRLTYLGARFGMAEMLLAGITTFVDMYYYEEEVARACLETGIRGYLGETVISQRAPDAAEDRDGLRRCEALLKAFAGSDRVIPIVAPHGTTTVSAEALRAAHALAERYDTLLTLHAGEMDYEMAHFAGMGTTPIAWLDSLGLCDGRLLAAHCIHLSGKDIALLRERGARVAHCIGSNTKAGKGVAPMRAVAGAGIPFGLGTDGPSSGNTLSLFDQMRLFAVCHKTANHDRTLFPAREIVAAATRGGAEALGRAGDFGTLAPGMRADLALVSTEAAHMFPVYNAYSALVYGACASDVRLVMADGEVLVRDGRLARMDLPALREELRQEMAPFLRAAERFADCV